MFKVDKNHKLDSGMSMPIAIVFAFCGLGILYAFNSSLYSKSYSVMVQYAEAQAQYNADSGIALEAVGAKNTEFSLYHREFYIPDGEDGVITVSDEIPNMGSYSVDLSIQTNDKYQIVKVAKSTGYATIKNSLYGEGREIKKTRFLELSNSSSLSDFLYKQIKEKGYMQ